nr:sigma-70 family RNA polymerase sigma factor [Romboutsia sp. 1001713B170131_170501_G6]
MAVSKYSKIVARSAFSYLKNSSDAEDITQEVFLALLQSDIRFEDDEHLKAWLIRVAINKCKNYLKSGWFKNKADLTDDLSYMTEEESYTLRAVLSLKEKYRLPIHLHYYEGYSIKEISQILEVPAATIGTRLARGRKELKKIIGEDIYEERYIQISR